MSKSGWFTGVVLSSPLWLAASAQAQVVINEIDYDQPSTDTTEFIELRNVGASAVSLAGYSLQLINGSGGAQYALINLPAVSLAAGDYFVVCANNATVANCDLDVSPDTNLIQNGDPDAMALRLDGVAVDRVSYKGSVPGFTEGTGSTAGDSASPGISMSRCPNGADTNNNNVDFQQRPTTPGVANDCDDDPEEPELGACGDPATAISAIQGAGATSPMQGDVVVIEAVVVGDFQDAQINGFYVQEEDTDRDANPSTSEGLFVFEGSMAVAVSPGDVVRVLGTVTEFDSLTELASVSGLLVCADDVASPEELSLPVDSLAELESLEGMRVDIDQPLTVTGNFELGRFGSLDLSANGRLFQPTHAFAPGAPALAQQDLNNRSRIILDDASNVQNPNPIPYLDADLTRRVGDVVPSLSGILDGRFGEYRIQPTGPVSFVPANPRDDTPNAVGGRLRVASFNVLNFFDTIDTGAFICGPAGNQECRGADSALELDRQREKLLNALEVLNADVLGLIEIENDATSAVTNLVNGLNGRLGAGTYTFVNTGTIGGDAIKLAFLYKPSKVTPVGAHAILDSTDDPTFLDNLNRPALAQTFAEVTTNARFTVVNNHLKSKGSDCDDVGDPDLGDGQGNCNGTRTAAAVALADWIGTDPTGSGDPDYLIIGDLNAYAQEDPITSLLGAGFESLVESWLETDAYSYQFDGQSGYLDHALSSASLVPQVTGVTEWHINADEPVVINYNTEFKTQDPFNPDDPFGASDHDPLVIGLNLTGGTVAAAVPALPSWALGLFGFVLAGLGALAVGPRRGHDRG